MEGISEEAGDADGTYVVLQSQGWGKRFEYCWSVVWEQAEGVFFILWRYEQKLPWFVRNWVRRKVGQSERESMWKMVGMNSLVWETFA